MKKHGFSERSKPSRGRRRRNEKTRRPRKRATNVSIDSDILDAARRLRINLSETLETALRRLVEDERIAKWQRDNKAFFDFANDYVERLGTMSEALLDLDDPAV